jgi:hypothetical protein
MCELVVSYFKQLYGLEELDYEEFRSALERNAVLTEDQRLVFPKKETLKVPTKYCLECQYVKPITAFKIMLYRDGTKIGHYCMTCKSKERALCAGC